jgi:hypothetical protein
VVKSIKRESINTHMPLEMAGLSNRVNHSYFNILPGDLDGQFPPKKFLITQRSIAATK